MKTILVLQHVYCSFSFLPFRHQLVCTFMLHKVAFESQHARKIFLKGSASAMNFWWLPA